MSPGFSTRSSHSQICPPTLDAGLALHMRGALEEAARVYQHILAETPQHADALHLLGVIAHQRGDSVRAVKLIHQAISLRPSPIFRTLSSVAAFVR